LKNKWACSSVG